MVMSCDRIIFSWASTARALVSQGTAWLLELRFQPSCSCAELHSVTPGLIHVPEPGTCAHISPCHDIRDSPAACRRHSCPPVLESEGGGLLYFHERGLCAVFPRSFLEKRSRSAFESNEGRSSFHWTLRKTRREQFLEAESWWSSQGPCLRSATSAPRASTVPCAGV